jgi:heme/copper-type cytochrome/quinol oxidase subunit 3
MSDIAVPRSYEKRGTTVAFWGMLMFIAAETALFAMMIGSYFYIRFKNLHWPPHGIPEPKVVVPLVLLGVLLMTLVPMQLAVFAGLAGRVTAARRLVFLALVVQSGYFAMEVHDYFDDLSRFTPQQHAYGSIYYTLLGADHAHVALGLLLDVWLLGKLARGLTTYRLNGLKAIAFYWYAVGAITIAVTLTILSPAV